MGLGPLLTPYLRTTYVAYLPDKELRIRIGQAQPQLDSLCVEWAFITAVNPGSRRLSREENAARLSALKAELSSLGYRWHAGQGIGDQGDWPPEESVLVLDIARATAVALARRYAQRAIVAGRVGEPAALVELQEANGQ